MSISFDAKVSGLLGNAFFRSNGTNLHQNALSFFFMLLKLCIHLASTVRNSLHRCPSISIEALKVRRTMKGIGNIGMKNLKRRIVGINKLLNDAVSRGLRSCLRCELEI